MPAPQDLDDSEALTTSNDAGPTAWRQGVVAFLVFVLAIAAYTPSFEGPFVWDDEVLVSREEVVEMRPISFYFARPFWLATDTQSGATYYRPITILSLAVDHAVHGKNPSGYHLTNLLLHGLNATLVLALGLRLRARLPIAALGALWFAWFPRLSEAAGWVSGRNDLLAGSFCLSALWLTLGEARGRAWGAATLVLLGILSKEVALSAAVAIAWYEWRSPGPSVRQRFSRLAPLAAAGLVYATLRMRVLEQGVAGAALTPTERLVAAGEALGRYSLMLVDAWHPRLNIGSLGSPNWSYVLLGGVVAAILVIVALRFRPEQPTVLLVTAGALAVVLVLHLIPFKTTVAAADRFLYLPIAAWAPVLAAAVSKTGRREVLGLAVAWTLSFLPVTWQRAKIWGDDILFWGTAVAEQDHATNALSHAGLAGLLASQGMYEEAMVVYERIQPGDRGPYLASIQRRATLLAMNGETERAVAAMERAARVQPSPRLYESLALSYAGMGNRERAREAAREFQLRVFDQARVADLWRRVGVLENQGRPLSQAEQALPAGASLQQRIAWAKTLGEAGRYRVAMTEFMAIVDDPGMTSQELRAILSFSLTYGTPKQVNRIHDRLLAMDPSTPPAFSLLVVERNHKVSRLRRLCRELDIPTFD